MEPNMSYRDTTEQSGYGDNLRQTEGNMRRGGQQAGENLGQENLGPGRRMGDDDDTMDSGDRAYAQRGDRGYGGVRDEMLGSQGAGEYDTAGQQQRRGGGVTFDEGAHGSGRRDDTMGGDTYGRRGDTLGENTVAGAYGSGRKARDTLGGDSVGGDTYGSRQEGAYTTQTGDQYGSRQTHGQAGENVDSGRGPAHVDTAGSSAAGIGAAGGVAAGSGIEGGDSGAKRHSKRDSTFGKMMEKAGGMFGSTKLEESGRERRERRASREY